MKKPTSTWFIAVGGITIVFVGYLLLRQKTNAATNANSTTGPFTYLTGYDPTGGISAANIGGSPALAPNTSAWAIGNANVGQTPIQYDPLTGGAINVIESKWANEPISVNPSSWQGTTNMSGSLTYLTGELAGEGSGTAQLQGVTY